MTVAELIAKLSQYPNSSRVVTRGFDENGIDDIETVETMVVVFHDDAGVGHVGRHEEVNEFSKAVDGNPAVFIN